MTTLFKIGSLFAGIGGLELGLEWAGLGRTVWQVEREEWCRNVLQKHWPNASRYDDVRTVGAHNLVPVDVICGGFPCQDISVAGKGAGLAGERSGLWFEYARIVGELRPRLVIVENVAALATRGLARVLGDLTSLGYDSLWFPVRASDVGAPHRRERLFIVGYATSNLRGPQRDALHPSLDRAGNLGVGLADSDGARESQSQKGEHEERGRASNGSELADAHEPRLERRRLQECERGVEWVARESGAGASAEGIAESGVGGTLDGIPAGLDRWPAGRGEAQHSWEPPRVTTKAHQRRQRLKALGNAVVPQVAYCVGLLAKELLQTG